MNDVDCYNAVKDIYMNNPKGFHMILKSKKNFELLNWINSKTPLLQNSVYTISTKCYWIFNDIHDFPTCEECGKKFGMNRNVDRRGYLTRFCSKKCSNNNEITKQHYRETCLREYGVDNPTKSDKVKKKYQQHMEQKYGIGITNAFQANEVKDKIKNKMLETYGVDNIAKTQYSKDKHKLCEKETVKKRNATKRKNHTFNTSKSEEEAYQLLIDSFGVENVIRQYSSEKYPFNCDFYVKTYDLYIEFNGSWTHGKHSYDVSSKNDQDIVVKWKSKNSKYYDIAIHTWTIRDVNKRNVAKANNLNIKEFWKLSELKIFLEEFKK